jgi:hypothetical protein
LITILESGFAGVDRDPSQDGSKGSTAPFRATDRLGAGGLMRGAVTPWRVNDAVAYEALLTVADRAAATTSDGLQLRDSILSLDGFDRRALPPQPVRLDTRSSAKTGEASPHFDVDAVLERQVIPTLFAGTRPTAEPRFVLGAGPPGSGAARTIGAHMSDVPDGIAVISTDALSSFHPEADDSTPDAQERVAEAAATWLSGCLRHAREERRSLLLAGPFPDVEAVVGVERLFHDDGFRTEVAVVATSPAENALSLASLYAHRLHAGARYATLDESDADQDFDHALTALRALETAAGVDRISVRNRDGEYAFDGTAAEDSLRGAAAAFETAARAPLSTLRAVQWLSELKRVTRFSRTLHPAPTDLTALLVDLHGRAIRDVVPTLVVPAGSRVTRGLDARLAEDLVQLRESLPARRSEAATGPIVAPGTPDMRGPSR